MSRSAAWISLVFDTAPAALSRLSESRRRSASAESLAPSNPPWSPPHKPYPTGFAPPVRPGLHSYQTRLDAVARQESMDDFPYSVHAERD